MFNTLKTIIPLALVCTVLIGYNYIDAQWVGPTQAPTAGNVPAPLNVGSQDQIKNARLGVDALSVYGDAEIVAPNPQLDLIDTTPGNERGWSLRGDGSDLNILRTDVDGNQVGDPIIELFYNASADQYNTRFDWTILTEGWLRSEEGVWIEDESPSIRFYETDGPYPGFWRYKIMPNQDFYNIYAERDFITPEADADEPVLFRLFASTTDPSGDYAQFSNEVRAEQYCDRTGTDCIDASSLAGGGGGGLGVGQEWQNVAGSRAAWTTYQNTTGQPIMVSIGVATDGSLQVSTDGTNWVSAGGVNWNNWYVSIDTIVPDGHYYRLEGGAIRRWSELR